MIFIVATQANQFLHNTIQVYEAVVIHRSEITTSARYWKLISSDLLSSLWIGLEGKLEYWQRLIKILL